MAWEGEKKGRRGWERELGEEGRGGAGKGARHGARRTAPAGGKGERAGGPLSQHNKHGGEGRMEQREAGCPLHEIEQSRVIENGKANEYIQTQDLCPSRLALEASRPAAALAMGGRDAQRKAG